MSGATELNPRIIIDTLHWNAGWNLNEGTSVNAPYLQTCWFFGHSYYDPMVIVAEMQVYLASAQLLAAKKSRTKAPPRLHSTSRIEVGFSQ